MIRRLLLTTLLVAPVPAFAQDIDTVLATVGDTEITLGNVIALRTRLPEQYQALPDISLYEGILDQMIQQQVLANAIEDSLTKGDELTLANERRAVLASRHIDRLAARPISEEEIEATYIEEFGGLDAETEWNASHILVATEDEARAIAAMLTDGQDFATLARERSTGPSGPNGGELGWFGTGQMVPEFEEAVKGLDDGAHSGPVQTQFGWHVVKLNESRLKEAPPLEDVRDIIEQGLISAGVEAEIQRLAEAENIDRADVDIDPSIIRNGDLVK